MKRLQHFVKMLRKVLKKKIPYSSKTCSRSFPMEFLLSVQSDLSTWGSGPNNVMHPTVNQIFAYIS